MSRTPVREALVRLENERLVQIIPRHGMRVVPLSLDDLRDMYEVLTALELTAIERLARSGPDNRSMAVMEQALDEMDAAIKKRDLDGWVKADERFHRMVIDLCGNARLASMAFAVWDQGHRARMTTLRLRPALETSNREHRSVVDAIRRRDWREAVARHSKHRRRTTARSSACSSSAAWALCRPGRQRGPSLNGAGTPGTSLSIVRGSLHGGSPPNTVRLAGPPNDTLVRCCRRVAGFAQVPGGHRATSERPFHGLDEFVVTLFDHGLYLAVGLHPHDAVADEAGYPSAAFDVEGQAVGQDAAAELQNGSLGPSAPSDASRCRTRRRPDVSTTQRKRPSGSTQTS